MVTTVPLLEIFPRLRWFKQDFSAFRRCLLKLHHWFFERYLRHGSFTSHQLHPIFPPTAACSKEATEKRTSFPYLEILETPKCETQFIPHYIVIYTVYINVFYTETGCRWRCETRRPRFATQSSDAFILNACAHCLALQMIFFSSPPQGSDDFCKQLVTQLNCGKHASCKKPRNTTSLLVLYNLYGCLTWTVWLFAFLKPCRRHLTRVG